ncbi:MAG: ABC transporter permease [Acidimicrobiales bacterium]|nr:ABC transporter permease [Acidimicrobiales bacterium]
MGGLRPWVKKAVALPKLGDNLKLIPLAVAVFLSFFLSGVALSTNHSVSGQFAQVSNLRSSGIDVVAHVRVPQGTSSLSYPHSIPASMPASIGEIPGVKGSFGQTIGFAQFLDPNGKPIGLIGSADIGLSYDNGPGSKPISPLGSVKELIGRLPIGPDEVAMDSETFSKYGFSIGEKVSIGLVDGVIRATLVGVVKVGGLGYIPGGTVALFSQLGAQRTYSPYLSEIDISLNNPSPQMLMSLANRLGPQYSLDPTSDVMNQDASTLSAPFRPIDGVLLGIGILSLLLCAYSIKVILSFYIEIKSRDLATLRLLGAQRRDLLFVVGMPVFVFWAIGATVGMAGGIVATSFISSIVDSFGISFPKIDLSFSLSANVLYPLALALCSLVFGGLVPARKLSKLYPLEAFKENLNSSHQESRSMSLVGTFLVELGVLLILFGVEASSLLGSLVFEIIGFALILVGIKYTLDFVISILSRRSHNRLGEYYLIVANLKSDLRRVSNLLFLTFIVSALMVAITCLSASVGSSITNSFNGDVKAQFFVASSNLNVFNSASSTYVQATPGVKQVAVVRLDRITVGSSTVLSYVVDPTTFFNAIEVHVISGSMAKLSQGGFAISQSVASSEGWHVGTMAMVDSSVAGPVSLRVMAIYQDSLLAGGAIYDGQAVDAGYGEPQAAFFLVSYSGSLDTGMKAVEASLRDFPSLEVFTLDSFSNLMTSVVSNVTDYVLELVVVSFILSLVTVFFASKIALVKRRREFGLIYAFGFDRSKILKLVLGESMFVALVGALTGGICGLAIGIAMARDLGYLGLGSVSIPIYFPVPIIFVVLVALGPIGLSLSGLKTSSLQSYLRDDQ